jgi:tRNA U34 5-methylaminomethyl-2-thiouridine-forming methyltransferase MnmC
MNNLEIVTTNDGSSSIFNTELNEVYHSLHGAIQESQHVYIKEGLLALLQNIDPINILEIGFGTGLNTLLTYIKTIENKLNINYSSIETDPLPLSFVTKLNYTNKLKLNKHKDAFIKLHQAKWNQETMINTNFKLTKIQEDLKTFQPKPNKYHLIYFDAFGPDIQPDLWSTEIFTKLNKSLKKEGILVTYSCKGEIKRNLRASNFKIKRLPGPPGKWQMLRAIKI